MTKTNTSYKESGIAWIGHIPNDWEIWKVSRIFRVIGSGTTPNTGQTEYYENGTIKWVNTGDLNDGLLFDCEKKITQRAFDEHSALRLYSPNSLIIAMYGATIGKVGLLQFEATTNQACCVLGNSDISDIKYIYYWFYVNKEHIVRMGYGGGQPNISQDTIKSLKIPLPPLPTQTSIANYLDTKTNQINDFITKKKKLIFLLQEQKQAIIHQAVTKGIDPSASMKDSKRPGIGEMPLNWEILKIKYLCYVKGRIGFHGLNSNEFSDDKTLPYLVTGTDFDNQRVNRESCYHISHERYEEDPYIQLKENDLLITKDGTIGKTAIVINKPRHATLNSGIMVVRCNHRLESKYLKFILNSNIFKNFTDILYQGSTIKHLYQQDFNNFEITLPPIKEQQQIINHIESRTSKIDQGISKIEQEIELIQEYRTSLIYHAVTGKINIE